MWAKLDDGLLDHAKILEAAIAFTKDSRGRDGRVYALGMFSAFLLYCNKHLTDGFISQAVLAELRFVSRPFDAARIMVQAGFWEEVNGGYRIHDYEKYNPSAEEVLSTRDWDRRRKALYSDPELLRTVRARDNNHCRYCGRAVNWHDRRGPLGGQYDHVQPRGENVLDNIVVACRGCNNKKKNRTPSQAGMRLLDSSLTNNGSPKND